jgi:DNA-binding CsgD family transcriptional regulator/PAS domain-containing protein
MPRSGDFPGVSLEDFSRVVEAAYDCALDPNGWQQAVRMIAGLLASQRCTLGVHDYANGCNDLMFQVGWDDADNWRLHEEKYSGMNPFFAPMQLMSMGEVATRAMLMPDDEFLDTRYYQEWVRPQGLDDMIAVKALQTGQRIGLLVANRNDTHPRYGEAELRLLTLLAPHICRAVAISDALSLKTVHSEALEATLNALAAAVYLTDRHGRVVFMNRAAEHQARTSNALRIDNNRVAPVDRGARAVLTKAVEEAIADETEVPAGGFTLALPDGEKSGLVATVLPLRSGERRRVCSAFQAFVAIFVQDPMAVPAFPGEAFAKLYGLTGGELRVLLAMAPGLSIKEAAEVLGISEATAKTHLQRIFAKTRTSKQTELMHLFMSSAPPIQTA